MPVLESPWMPLERMRFATVSAHLVNWLADGSSLTQRLVEGCNGNFNVRLRRQGWHQPLYSEMRLLGMREGESALVREVELLCDDTALVFARTLIPANSLKGEAKKLGNLGNRPLGAVLFNNPLTKRTRVEVAKITPRHKLFDEAVKSVPEAPVELWGRRTIFNYAGSFLLVNEIFLPAIDSIRIDL